MKYDTLKTAVKRRYTRKDGYAGKLAIVGLAFDAESGAACEVADCGYYRANNRKYQSEAEMLYYFDHHQKVHFLQVINNLS